MIRGARVRYLTTTAAMVLLGVVWFTAIDRPAAPRPVRMAGAAAPARLSTPVTAREVLAEADVLQLMGDQRTRLASAAAAWDAELASLEGAISAATDEFARFASEAQKRGRARLDDVRGRTEDIQSLSALLRQRRARHADDALGALSAAQRVQISDRRRSRGGTR
jgi:hypothetical protein